MSRNSTLELSHSEFSAALKPSHRDKTHTDDVSALAILPEDPSVDRETPQVVSASDDGTLRIWERGKAMCVPGRLVRTLGKESDGHTDEVSAPAPGSCGEATLPARVGDFQCPGRSCDGRVRG